MSDVSGKIDWCGQIFPKRDNLTDDLTTIDFLKCAAILLMVIDHIGYFLFPEIEWFRVIGRLSAPIWFFLIGFSNNRDMPTRWIVVVFIMLFSSMLVGMPPLPLTVIMTMGLVRLTFDLYWGWQGTHQNYLLWVVLLLIFFSLPTGMFSEYGTMGFLMAMTGYCVRHRALVTEVFGPRTSQWLMIATLGSFGVLSSLYFGFSPLAWMVLFAGLTGLYFILQDFESKTLLGTAGNLHAPLIRFMGRYSLEIYVIHLLVFKGVYALQQIARAVI